MNWTYTNRYRETVEKGRREKGGRGRREREGGREGEGREKKERRGGRRRVRDSYLNINDLLKVYMHSTACHISTFA